MTNYSNHPALSLTCTSARKAQRVIPALWIANPTNAAWLFLLENPTCRTPGRAIAGLNYY